MEAVERRKEILSILKSSERPVSAASLAARFDVSRQIIVGDIALLRAAGADIQATPRGYLTAASSGRGQLVRQVACRHTSEDVRTELYAMVDEGVTVRDVIVEHPIYGQLTGMLLVRSRHDADEVVRASMRTEAQPLSVLTQGIHLHTLICPDEASYQRVLEKLRSLGFLYES